MRIKAACKKQVMIQAIALWKVCLSMNKGMSSEQASKLSLDLVDMAEIACELSNDTTEYIGFFNSYAVTKHIKGGYGLDRDAFIQDVIKDNDFR